MNLIIGRAVFKALAALLVVLSFTSTKVEAQAWVARHALTPAQFQSTFDDLFKQGYRLKSMSGYVSGGERYAALWLKEPGPAWQARMGLSAADLQKTFDDLRKQGYRMIWISGHEFGGSVRYE